jgi:hypothetical protein
MKAIKRVCHAQALFLCSRSGNDTGKMSFRHGQVLKKKNPRWKSGGPNQKPLTIKPYPMKIHC